MTKVPHIHIAEQTAIGYGRTEVAVAEESIDLPAGNHFLLARNGRGKTTLLRTLAGSLKPVRGTAETTGRIQFIGDELSFDRWMPATSIFHALLRQEARRPAMELADLAELPARKPFGQLSKGNKQKVLLILAEYRVQPDEPSILLLDEPFTGLDTHARDCFSGVWRRPNDRLLRLITIHPDYDAADLGTPVLISEGKIRHAKPGEGSTWGQIKTQLK